MQKIIRLGDKTSHGGTVVSATSHVTVGGLPVARVGDKCTCPKRGHNNCVIVEGDPNWTIDGIPVALEGHKISCGAVLIASAPNTGRVYEGATAASLNESPAIASTLLQVSAPAQTVFDYDEHFILFDESTGEALENWVYRIHALGQTAGGVTDNSGKTGRVGSHNPGEVVLEYAYPTRIAV